MGAENRTRNVMSGASSRTFQVGTLHGDLTISDGAPRTRRRLAVCAALAATVLTLYSPQPTTPAPGPERSPQVAESGAPPVPKPWEISSSGTGRGDTELSSRSGTPDGPSSGAQCRGTGENTHCEVSSGVTITPGEPPR